MAISYKKLWKLLIDKDMKKKDLQRAAGISAASITKLGKNENVNTEIIEKICVALQCDVSDIIGVAEPVSISVDCFGTQRVPRAYIVSWIRKHYDLTPAGIIRSLCLRDVDYNAVSSYGHFWRSWMPWEK